MWSCGYHRHRTRRGATTTPPLGHGSKRNQESGIIVTKLLASNQSLSCPSQDGSRNRRMKGHRGHKSRTSQGGAPARTHSGRCSAIYDEAYAIYSSRHDKAPTARRLPMKYGGTDQQPSEYTRRSPTDSSTTTMTPNHLLAHLRNLLVILVFIPFSTSSGRNRGVGGTSSAMRVCFRRPEEEVSGSLRWEGNSERRGVRAVLTFLADLRRVSFMVHSRFLAMKKRAPVVAKDGSQYWHASARWWVLLSHLRG